MMKFLFTWIVTSTIIFIGISIYWNASFKKIYHQAYTAGYADAVQKGTTIIGCTPSGCISAKDRPAMEQFSQSVESIN